MYTTYILYYTILYIVILSILWMIKTPRERAVLVNREDKTRQDYMARGKLPREALDPVILNELL